MFFFTEFYEFLVMFMNFMNSMLPRTAPFYSLWSFYGLYTGLFVFDSMVLFFFNFDSIEFPKVGSPYTPF